MREDKKFYIAIFILIAFKYLETNPSYLLAFKNPVIFFTGQLSHHVNVHFPDFSRLDLSRLLA